MLLNHMDVAHALGHKFGCQAARPCTDCSSQWEGSCFTNEPSRGPGKNRESGMLELEAVSFDPRAILDDALSLFSCEVSRKRSGGMDTFPNPSKRSSYIKWFQGSSTRSLLRIYKFCCLYFASGSFYCINKKI